MKGHMEIYNLRPYLRLKLFLGLFDGLLLGHVELLHVLLDDRVEGLLVDDTHHDGDAVIGVWIVFFDHLKLLIWLHSRQSSRSFLPAVFLF